MKQFPGEDFLGSLYVFDGRITERFTNNYEVVGVCDTCGEKSEHYGNCGKPDCHKKMIICEACEGRGTPIFCTKVCEEVFCSALKAV